MRRKIDEEMRKNLHRMLCNVATALMVAGAACVMLSFYWYSEAAADYKKKNLGLDPVSVQLRAESFAQEKTKYELSGGMLAVLVGGMACVLLAGPEIPKT
jgi:hypothetical protein